MWDSFQVKNAAQGELVKLERDGEGINRTILPKCDT